ncbi:MAG: glycosyltransferase family 4 protein [Candidatus Dormibacteraeota bacterium]|nr:glycosyltransferase family 4 protein [Candidatus Dormibacteraeota bacterium]
MTALRFLLDGRPLRGPSAVRGIGSYERGLLAGLSQIGAARNTGLILAAQQPLPEDAARFGIQIAAPRIATFHPTLQPVLDPLLLSAALRRVRPALYHGVEWGQPLRTTVPVVVTVHDLIPFVFPSDYPWVRRSRVPALHLLRHAARVITPSEATARDVVRYAHVDSDRIAVVTEGIDPAFQPVADDRVTQMRRELGIPRPYVLSVGTFDARKRIDLLAECFARIRSAHDVDLVIAGDQGTFAGRVTAALTNRNVAGNTHLVGRVGVETLVSLYSGAKLLLFASAYEGFGLPPLEAMACGTEVVMFANSSLTEVAGPAVVVRPDGDATALARAACDVLATSPARKEERQKRTEWAARFTWPAAAARTVEVYETAIAEQGKRRTP